LLALTSSIIGRSYAKIQIPNDIINKTGISITEEEYEKKKNHKRWGKTIRKKKSLHSL
jgi:response regulator RpfG family c-di-GMP phosphodiesterase